MSETTTITEHAWTREHAAAYVTGGLTVDETLRLEGHVRECADCAAAVDAERRFDRDLAELFAPVVPGPDLEDRAVGRLRTGRPRGLRIAGWPRRALVAALVLIALGGVGATAGGMLGPGGLPMPGNVRGSLARWKDEFTREGRSYASLDVQAVDNARWMEQSLAVEDGGRQMKREEAANETRKRHAEALAQLQTEAEKGRASNWGNQVDLSRGAGSSLNAARPEFYRFNDLQVDGTYTGDVETKLNLNMFGLMSPQFDPTAKPLAAGYANPYYAATNGAWFKPGEHKLGLTPVTPVVPGATTFQPPDQKKEPPKDVKPAQKGPDVLGFDPQPARRVVIRSGDIEFEVESFDPAIAAVTKLVAGLKGAFIATVNSEKLPNGKVKGSITVRTPPEHLDGLVLDLRKELGKGGELKGVKITSQDVTKQFFDLESRLKAARAMEQRLLAIIKEGKGDIKALLEAERELGVWRTKIEEFEGEIRYYSNLAALSTLTITLAEKEIRAAAGLTESERVQAGVEVEDVDRAYQQLLAAVVEAKGRISKSELKQLALGQFNASLQFEVAPEAAGPLRDRLHQLGRVARLEIDRVQSAQGTVTPETKAKRGDTVFVVQLYNLANVAPRETTALSVATTDVAAAYHAIRTAVAKTTGRIHAAQLNEQDRQNLSAQIDFEVRRSEEAAIRAELEKAGEVIARQVTRAPEGENVTDSKVLFRTTIIAANRLKPRELTTLSVEVPDVEQSASVLAAQAAGANARPIDSRINREPNGKVTARLVFEVPLAAAAGLAEQFKKVGTVRAQQSVRDPQAPEGRFATARIDVTLTSAEKIVGDDAGVWPPVKKGLAYSASVLLTSLTWVVFGLCVVLPWALVGYGGYRVVRWMGRPAAAGTTITTA